MTHGHFSIISTEGSKLLQKNKKVKLNESSSFHWQLERTKGKHNRRVFAQYKVPRLNLLVLGLVNFATWEFRIPHSFIQQWGTAMYQSL